MKKSIVIVMGLGLMLACGAIFVTAQSGAGTPRAPQRRGIEPPPPPPPPPPPLSPPHLDRLARDLNLTEAQQSELKAFMDAQRATMDALRKKMDAERGQLDAATASGQFDEAQVRSLAAQQAQTHADLLVEQKRIEAKIYSLLTPEQRARFEQLRRRRQPPPLPPPPPDEAPPDR